MRNLSFVFALLFAAAAARAQTETRTFTPFFDFGVGESVYVPTGEDIFFSGANMKGDVGLSTNLTNAPLLSHLPGKSALFTLYTFNYDGPGFQPQDNGGFQYRDMSHNLSGEYRWSLGDHWRIRPGFGFTKTFVRTAANEIWGQGLYDSKALGPQVALDYLIPHGALTAQYIYRKITYPNFTDLLRVFQGAGTDAQVAGGLQDNNLTEGSFSVTWKKLFADVRYDNQDYLSQTVIDITGPNAGAYGTTPQATHSISGDLGFEGHLWRFEIRPKGTVTQYTSNQNFLDFKYVGDTSPNAYSDWYSYTEYRGDLPLFINLTEGGTAVFGDLNVDYRTYKDRVAKDASDNSLGVKEWNLLATATAGFRFRINDVSYMKLFGGVTQASSNNKFETYLPYNYTGAIAGIGFDMAY